MNPLTWLALRLAIQVVQAEGVLGTAAGQAVAALMAAVAAGKNVDAHMAAVAAKLESGEPIDWEEVKAGALAASADLQSPPTG